MEMLLDREHGAADLARTNLSRSQTDRAGLAEYRIGRVLRTYTVASMRPLALCAPVTFSR
jgi:hypothetical protein